MEAQRQQIGPPMSATSEHVEAHLEKWRLSFEAPDGVPVGARGLCVETVGLSAQLAVLRAVWGAMQNGVALFPGQDGLRPQLTRLFQKPLQVVVAGRLQVSPAVPAGMEEGSECEFAQPAEGVGEAIAAIRALAGKQIIMRVVIEDAHADDCTAPAEARA